MNTSLTIGSAPTFQPNSPVVFLTIATPLSALCFATIGKTRAEAQALTLRNRNANHEAPKGHVFKLAILGALLPISFLLFNEQILTIANERVPETLDTIKQNPGKTAGAVAGLVVAAGAYKVIKDAYGKKISEKISDLYETTIGCLPGHDKKAEAYSVDDHRNNSYPNYNSSQQNKYSNINSETNFNSDDD